MNPLELLVKQYHDALVGLLNASMEQIRRDIPK